MSNPPAMFPRLKPGLLLPNRAGNHCAKCVHWLENPDNVNNLTAPRMGLCTLNPPAMLIAGFGRGANGEPVPNLMPVRPVTGTQDWCGQWEAD